MQGWFALGRTRSTRFGLHAGAGAPSDCATHALRKSHDKVISFGVWNDILFAFFGLTDKVFSYHTYQSTTSSVEQRSLSLNVSKRMSLTMLPSAHLEAVLLPYLIISLNQHELGSRNVP